MDLEFKVGKKIEENDYHIFKAEKWEKQSPDGKVRAYTKLKAPNWVGAIVFNNDTKKFICVKEYRHGIDKVVAQFPCGTVEKDEAPENAMIREVCEELGITEDDILKYEQLYSGNPNPAFMDNTMTFYVVEIKSFKPKKQKLDESEFVEVIELTADGVEDFISLPDTAITQKFAWKCL